MLIADTSMSLDGYVAGPDAGDNNVLIGGGTRLFAGVLGRWLEQIRCVESPFATHLRFRIK